MDFKFDRGKHIYTIGGRIIPSVSQILKLLNPNAHYYIADKYKLRGSWVHYFCEIIINGGNYMTDGERPPTPEEMPFVEAFEKKFDYGFGDPIFQGHFETEKSFGSIKYRYGGTVDMLNADGKCIIDIKSGSVNLRSFTRQLHLYRILVMENLKWKKCEMFVLNLQKTGRARIISIPFDRTIENVVKSAVITWHDINHKKGE